VGTERQVSPKEQEPVPFSEVRDVHLGNKHTKIIICSLAGEVRLWDVRSCDRAVQAWDPHPTGLSCFDVHPQTGLFATCVNVLS